MPQMSDSTMDAAVLGRLSLRGRMQKRYFRKTKVDIDFPLDRRPCANRESSAFTSVNV
ncbi:hypothetical protein Pla52o_39570 [Novipirellula galeiformis]|uniref:Uncharacterized protein n=1 Tax=Novipirellula galeiformis TaxID=2528004 RepID=A0A5C6CBZ5_9BACT|nr:hypothetical protein Pla52o_39570 [Novipirellula galeiformis]